MFLTKYFYQYCNNIVVMTVGAFTNYGHNETLKSVIISNMDITTKWLKENRTARTVW